MTVTFVGSDIGDSSSATTIALTLPTHQTDDFGLIVGYSDQDINTHAITVASGWINLFDDLSSLGRDQHTSVWYKKFTSSSETNPTFSSTSTSEEISASVHVFRNVDTVLPFEGFTTSHDDNIPSTPPEDVVPADIVTDNDAACGFRAMCVTHDDITTLGTPSGYTDGESVFGAAADFRQQTCAYDLDLGTAGTKSAPTFGHTLNNNVAEYRQYFVALADARPIHLTGGTVLGGFGWGAEGLTVTGDGFESTQGTGKVEIWDDLVGTTKTSQTIDSWSDTSIQIKTVQGSLPDDTTVYVVVTNDSLDQTSPANGETIVGYPAYNEMILSLDPDHYWRLNNVYTDTGITGPQLDMTSSVIGTWTFNTQEIADGNTHSLNMDAVTDRREILDSPNMNITVISAERTIAYWLQLDGIQHSLAAVFKEGAQIQNLAFLVGYGNVILFQGADTPGNAINAQAWSDFKLTSGRPYHICGRYSLSEDPKELRLYIDGVEQTNTSGNPLDNGTFDAHSGDCVWGDPDGTLETGGTDITYQGQEDAQISDFATWSDNSAGDDAGGLDKVIGIRNILFRRGAIPGDIVVTGSQSAMQTALDADADTRPNWPLSFRIEPVAGGGDLELTMNDKVFDPLITMHLEYRGVDTLTLINSGTSNLDAAKTFSPSGGTIVLIPEVDIKVTCIDFNDVDIQSARVLITAGSSGEEIFENVLTQIVRSGSVATVTTSVVHDMITGDKILIEDAVQPEYNGVHTVTVTTTATFTYTVSGTPTTPATGTILATYVHMDDTTDVNGEITVSYRYTDDTPIVGLARKGTSTPFFKNTLFSGTITSTGLDQTIFMIADE